MHRCLLIQEMVQSICDEIDDQGVPRNAQLLAMAQTCRDLRDIALASLWTFIPDIIPIIKCAGRDLWEIRAGYDIAKRPIRELHLSRSLSRDHIKTMSKYAFFVRQFGCSKLQPPWTQGSIVVHSDVWNDLRRAFKKTPLFPNLRRIYLGNLQKTEATALFFIQHITSLQISLSNTNQPDLTLPQAYTLVNLSAQSLSHTCVSLEAFAEAGPNLSPVKVFPITPSFLQAFTHQSSSLQHLEFTRFTPPGGASQQSLYQGTPMFPVLEKTPVRFDKLFHALPFIDHFPATDALTLQISDNSIPSEDEVWKNLSRSIKKHRCSLQVLATGEGKIRSHGDNTREILHSQLLDCFEGFQALTRLAVYHFGGRDIDDELLKSLTTGLSQLEYLALIDYSVYSVVNPPAFKITIPSFDILAKNCPQLAELDIGFDAREHQISLRWRPPVKARQLVALYTSVSPVNNLPLACIALGEIFPNIRHVWGDGPVGDIEAGEPWLGWLTINQYYQAGRWWDPE